MQIPALGGCSVFIAFMAQDVMGTSTSSFYNKNHVMQLTIVKFFMQIAVLLYAVVCFYLFCSSSVLCSRFKIYLKYFADLK